MLDFLRPEAKPPVESKPDQSADTSSIEAKYNEVQHENQVQQNAANTLESNPQNTSNFAGNEAPFVQPHVSDIGQNEVKLPPVYNTPEPVIHTANGLNSNPVETPRSEVKYDALGNPVLPDNPEVAARPQHSGSPEQANVDHSSSEESKPAEATIQTESPEKSDTHLETVEKPEPRETSEEAKKWIKIIDDKIDSLQGEKSKLTDEQTELSGKISNIDEEIARYEETKRAFENPLVGEAVKFMESHKNEKNDKTEKSERDSVDKIANSESNQHTESSSST